MYIQKQILIASLILPLNNAVGSLKYFISSNDHTFSWQTIETEKSYHFF